MSDKIIAEILLQNLIKRIVSLDDGSKQLPGVITDDEFKALNYLITNFESNANPEAPSLDSAQTEQPKKNLIINLNLSTLNLSPAPSNIRICLDFGTAMSKATLVKDDDYEIIDVLKLGIPGDQQQISETMLVSSVYISNDGKIWFGQNAVDQSLTETNDGSRQRLDNIKRSLSEEGLDNKVEGKYNPTKFVITYSDMVLAYLMFFTWTVNKATEVLGYPRNLMRRFAMPCFSKSKERETNTRLKKMLGNAQILADTFDHEMHEGIPLEDYLSAINKLKEKKYDYSFILEGLTEPLGVASSLVSWHENVDMLVMIVDVGAGTTDFSLNRIHVDPTSNKSSGYEVKDTAVGITEAGNYLDRILIEFILNKVGVTSDNPSAIEIRSELELSIRNYKESLFKDKEVYISINRHNIETEILLDDFLKQDAVKRFGESLKSTLTNILESINISWIEWVKAHPSRRLVIALTGGGADLPMVRELAKNDIKVNGLRIPVSPAISFPLWLSDDYPDLEQDYHRIAVSLGGARKQLIQREGPATITAGDISKTPVLGGYYTKG